ncbi:endonuclease/exonuclease/phosphatase family protein [Vibrio crassostreae]|uniref:endonuclease/exonuclease/phosphatase family protein n=1 Tax=Vibrio crassostreae TaxID=246167 RepID=UPI004068FE2E
MSRDHLRLGWWNVNLSSTAKAATTNGTADVYIQIAAHILRLFSENSYHFLALGEVSKEDMIGLQNALSVTTLNTMDLTDEVGATRFDIGIIYNDSAVNVIHERSISRKITGNTIKGAQLVRIIEIDTKKEIYTYLCHWPSRLMDTRDKRSEAAKMVNYDASNQVSEGHDVIIMGDFNDNPYDSTMTDGLKATRCHDAVKKYPDELFYNPFWREVVSPVKYNNTTSTSEFKSGTYKYKNNIDGVAVMWNCLDQILLSGSFLTGAFWHLNENNTHIELDTEILQDYEGSDSKIDHLPIVCEVTLA